MGNIYFISDVHLGAQASKTEKVKTRRLLSFFDHVGQYGDRLIIVGDLFDFWFEYRSVIPKGYSKIFCGLSFLQDLGKEVDYIAGNHDFWMKNYLSQEFGVNLYFDQLELKINQKKFFIFHGDGISKNDKGYRLLKRIFRNRFNIFLYSLLHPDLGVPLAKWVSSLSRNHTGSQGPPDDTDYVQFALKKFEEGFDYVVCGHLHSPRMQPFGQKVYMNLGDWIDHFTYAEFDGENLTLQSWSG